MQTQQKVYQAFYRLAYQVIIQITKDHAATEDIIQESFLKAIDHKPAIRSEAQLINWLKVVIRNSTYNYLRKHKKRLNKVDVESVFIDNTIDYATEVDFIEREINVKELEAAIGKYLQELKPDF
jgi:RNA polymerase sigma-70 factor (ECF subfamily)